MTETGQRGAGSALKRKGRIGQVKIGRTGVRGAELRKGLPSKGIMCKKPLHLIKRHG